MPVGYVIKLDEYEYNSSYDLVKTGRKIYYTRSKSRKIDRSDIRHAFIFPTMASVSGAKPWVGEGYEVIEVESIEIKLGKVVTK